MGMVSGMTVRDLANVGDPSIDALVSDLSLVSRVECIPNPATISIAGNIVSAEAELTIHYTDYSSVTVKTVLTGDTGDGLPGLRNLTRVCAGAA
ncbi:hypothetical protein [Sphingomonas sp. 3-13AW]|uniref:hypothetical protein n=1 Tax=Sphingomonas sp. 3-13AW TaxID=3050450 RepID=UPI003BB75E1A